MSKTTDNRYLISAIFFTVACLYGFFPTDAHAAPVTGRYLSNTGTTIVLEISISKPAPSSIIVEQSIAKSNTILSVNPNPKKVTKSGQIKWLLTNLRPGKQRLTTKLSGPLNGNVRGILRYRDPASGQFTEVSITP
jgi:hypothetical protein